MKQAKREKRNTKKTQASSKKKNKKNLTNKLVEPNLIFPIALKRQTCIEQLFRTSSCRKTYLEQRPNCHIIRS